MTIAFHGKTLTIDGTDHEMEQPVLKAIELEGRVIVQLDWETYPLGDRNGERNIIAVSKSGEMLWRIVRGPIRRGGEKGPDLNPYTGMGYAEDGRTLMVYDVGGCEYDLDSDTGEVSNPVFSR